MSDVRITAKLDGTADVVRLLRRHQKKLAARWNLS
jgi:hypothetical protein